MREKHVRLSEAHVPDGAPLQWHGRQCAGRFRLSCSVRYPGLLRAPFASVLDERRARRTPEFKRGGIATHSSDFGGCLRCETRQRRRAKRAATPAVARAAWATDTH